MESCLSGTHTTFLMYAQITNQVSHYNMYKKNVILFCRKCKTQLFWFFSDTYLFTFSCSINYCIHKSLYLHVILLFISFPVIMLTCMIRYSLRCQMSNGKQMCLSYRIVCIKLRNNFLER